MTNSQHAPNNSWADISQQWYKQTNIRTYKLPANGILEISCWYVQNACGASPTLFLNVCSQLLYLLQVLHALSESLKG